MKTQAHINSHRVAFTLMELLVVISIIAVLAALLFPVAGILKKKAAITRVRTEMKLVEAAIDAYKENVKTYPPENTVNPALNMLFYELSGTKLVGGAYQPASGGDALLVGSVSAFFGAGISGFQNVTRGTDDELKAAKNCLGNVRSSQYLAVTNGVTATLLGTREKGPLLLFNNSQIALNPWRYRAASATNNPGRYDLWVDVTIGSSDYRIANWSDKEIKL